MFRESGEGTIFPRHPSPNYSVSHRAIADTAPDAWGRRVIALRLRDAEDHWLRLASAGRRSTSPLIEFARIFQASNSLERGQETIEDLRYLQGKGTSLGGMRPKCTLLDSDDRLAIGKIPSTGDTRSVTRGEVLVLSLAARAGIDAATARIVQLGDVPIAIICRFDRDDSDGRIPFQSAASILQASREDDRSCTEIADAIRACGYSPTNGLQQL